MCRLMICAAAVALCGLGGANLARAQEKIAPPVKTAVTTEACHAPCLEKVCVPVPDKMKISKTVYSCKEKDICLPRCPPFSFHRGCRDHCNDHCGDHCTPQESCPSCAHRPRTVAVLMKKVVVTECPTTKCVVSHQEAPCAPVCAPACPPACTTNGHAAVTTTTMPLATGPLTITPATITPATPRTAAPAQPINVRQQAAPQALPMAPPTLTIEGLLR